MLEQDPDSEATYYLILRGVDRFFTEFSALPGALADQVEPDISHLKNCVSKVIKTYFTNTLLLLYSRRGQTEAHGPHAARQRFFAGLAANLNDVLISY